MTAEMSGTVTRIALVESLGADGQVLHAQDVWAWPVHIGRALDNHVVLHDPHAAARHATLDVGAGSVLTLTAGESLNGVRVSSPTGMQALAAGQQATMAPLGRFHIGHTVLRVRRPEDPLAAERPLAAPTAATWRGATPALAAAVLAWTAGSLWLDKNPGAAWDDYAPLLLATAAGFVLWAGLWGLVSKLFTRHFSALPHLRVALAYSLVLMAADTALALLSYMLDWPWASRIRAPVAVLVGAAMLAHHLRLVAPAHPRRIALGMAALALLGLAGGMALQWQRSERLFEELYISTLPPPAWRLVGAKPVESLTQELLSLEAPMLESARKAAKKENE
jgi:hypothetical protein